MSRKMYYRSVIDLGSGCRGATIPAWVADRCGVAVGDNVGIEITDDRTGVTYHLTGDHELTRSVHDGGNGTRGVALPADMADDYGVELHDKIPVAIDHATDDSVTYFFD